LRSGGTLANAILQSHPIFSEMHIKNVGLALFARCLALLEQKPFEENLSIMAL